MSKNKQDRIEFIGEYIGQLLSHYDTIYRWNGEKWVKEPEKKWWSIPSDEKNKTIMDKGKHIGQRKQEDNLWYEWNGEEWLLEVENHCTENVDYIKDVNRSKEDAEFNKKDYHFDHHGYKLFEDMKHKLNLEVKENFKESDGKLTYELEWEFIERMAKRMELNKSKYEPYNWKNNPINPQKLKEAMSRHFVEVMKGNYEDDGEYGHLVALACNAMMIIEQLKKNNKTTGKYCTGF